MLKKREGDAVYSAKSYLVVEDSNKPSKWHLRFADENGKPDPQQMGQAWAALTSNYRGEPYKGPGKAEALEKLKKIYETIGRKTPTEAQKEWREAWKNLREYKEIGWRESSPASVIDWLLPYSVSVKEEDEAKAPAAEGDGEAVKPTALHIRIGKALEKVGVTATKDIYGKFAEAHGSAWSAPLKNFQAIQKALWGLGYRPKGKGKFSRGPVMIEVGQDAKAGKLFMYITDDNGPTVGPKTKESESLKHMPGRHEQKMHGNRDALTVADKTDVIDKGLSAIKTTADAIGFSSGFSGGATKRVSALADAERSLRTAVGSTDYKIQQEMDVKSPEAFYRAGNKWAPSDIEIVARAVLKKVAYLEKYMEKRREFIGANTQNPKYQDLQSIAKEGKELESMAHHIDAARLKLSIYFSRSMR